MSQKEKEAFERAAESFKKRITRNQDAARQFLVELGVFTPEGKLCKPYKHLCIPPARD